MTLLFPPSFPSWVAVAALLVTSAVLPAGTPLSAQEPVDTVRLPALEVSAASRLPQGSRSRAAEVLDRGELDRLPVRTVGEALRWAVGVDLQPRSPAQSDLSLRGSSFEQVVVLMDGVPMSDAQTGHFDMDLTVPLELVERIEVVRGPASSLYGADAMGGVVNIVTRKGAEAPTGSVRAEAGSFGSRAVAAVVAAPLPGGWRAAASAERDESDGHRDGVDHAMTLTHANLGGPLGPGELHVSGGWSARDFGADGFYAPFPSYEETRTRFVAAGWRGPVEGVELELRGFSRRRDDDFVLRRGDPAFYRNVHTSWQEGGQVTLRLEPGADLTLAVGGEVARDRLESTNLGDRSEVRGGGYLEAAWLGDGSQLRGGLRLEAREGFGSWVAPSLSGAVEVAPNLRLRAGVGRSYRTPTYTERYYEDPANVGRADLGSESAWTVEGGADWAPGGGAVLRATLFRRSADALIDWARPEGAPEGVPWETRNVESATFTGLELDVDRVPLGPVTLEASASLLALDTEERPGFESKVALRPLTRNVTAGVAIPLARGAEMRLRLQALRREGGESYEVGDLRLAGGLLGARIWVDVTNLGDTRYQDITGLPGPGRAVRTGLRVPLG